jgi:coenzyme F420 hydrogenase subunit beta
MIVNMSKVINTIVKNDLCIGCGLCVYACPSNALQMQWDEHGFLVPELAGICDSKGDCLEVCPFNPFPQEEVRTENELSDVFLPEKHLYHPKIGKYRMIYAGYSNEFRLSSSSGGIATYILAELLKKGIVDHVFSVKESQKNGLHYDYSISSSKEELIQASKTKYFPVTLAEVLKKLKTLDGKVAIVGVACFIKAIRLAQFKEPELKDKIPFLVGIICGGVKGRFFTEYLASKVGVERTNISNPRFRIKDYNSTAGDYSFGCMDKATKEEGFLKMLSIGDMWGTGFFKANACDFCDDVTTELADVSLGDAWVSPYDIDGRGANVMVVRSGIANLLIQDGIRNGSLTIEELSEDKFLFSQRGSFNHRHVGLPVRIRQALKEKKPVPPKRFGKHRVAFDFQVVQKMRMKARTKSLEIWKVSSNAEMFDRKMKLWLIQFKIATKVYHYRKAMGKRFDKLSKFL